MTSLRIILLMLFIALALHLTACAENRQPDLVFTGEVVVGGFIIDDLSKASELKLKNVTEGF